jgi:hypothetical protein
LNNQQVQHNIKSLNEPKKKRGKIGKQNQIVKPSIIQFWLKTSIGHDTATVSRILGKDFKRIEMFNDLDHAPENFKKTTNRWKLTLIE